MKYKTIAYSILAACSGLIQINSANADLVIYYPFDTDGGTVVPNVGTGGDGALVGGGTYGPAQSPLYGNAFIGNRAGANDAFVTTGLTGDDLGMGAGGVYTAMAWINWGGVDGSNDHMIFGQLDGPGNNAQLHHGIRSEGDDPNVDNIHFGGWGGAQDIGDAGTVAPDTWTHVAWQYDGTDKVVYVNGVESTRVAGNNITAPALEVIIGGHGRDIDPAQSFNGAIDEVRVYDEALTAAEIAALMVPLDDADGDGLSNEAENTIHMTDPNDPDSDDDGLNDGVEVANGLDPNSGVGDDGADGDPDGDDLTNKDEIDIHRTDPREADTDMDGLEDGVEVNTHGSDPRKADSDGDTLGDADEVNIHMTDPNSSDSDGDLFTDDAEITAGSDPNDVNSTPDVPELPEPLLYYPFNEENGTEVENLGSLATAGVLQGAGTYGESVDASFGTAFVGNRTGVNDAQVLTGHPGNDLGMGAAGVYTAMAWINWAGTSGGVDHMVFGAPGAGNFEQLHHGIRDDSAPNNVHFGGWGGAQDVSDAGAVPVGEWTHVAWQYDGTDKVVYVNGAETTRVAGNNVTDPSLDVAVGFTARDGMGSFNGSIDEVKIYGAALTEAQVREAMVPGSSAGGSGLEVRSIDYDGQTDTVTLTFTSRPGRSYSLLWTDDMQDGPDFNEIDDSIDANADGDLTTYTFVAPRPDVNPGGPPVQKAFFFVKQN